jgi:membrane-associated protein
MFDLVGIIKTAGYAGLFGIIFAESGLLIGFFLPGDSLLFTAGFLASQGLLHIWVLIPLLFAAAVIGDNVGYAFGRRVGPKVFNRPNSLFFQKTYIARAQHFFEQHGGKTIILARFVPIVRTFTPVLAGVGNMHYRTFVGYNIIGGFLWTAGLSLLGYYLGKSIPNVDHYLLPIVAIIIIISLLPSGIHVARDKTFRRNLKHHLLSFLKIKKS